MSTGVNMSLDDIISANKKSKGNRQVGGSLRSDRPAGGRSGGAKLAGRGGRNNYAFSESVPDGKWKHDKYQESQAPRVGGGGNPNKKVTINLSNLHPTKVFSADLEELFLPYEDVESVVVHYDENGASLGTGAIVCSMKTAKELLSAFDNVKLDGQLIKMALVDSGSGLTAGGIKSRLEFVNKGGRISKPERNSGNGRGGVNKARRPGGADKPRKAFLDRVEDSDEEEKPRGGGRGGRGGRGGGREGREKKVEKTAEELDAELDKYMNKGKAMEA